MNYYIITGTSRGLGEALVKDLLKEGNYIFCISRNRNENLIEQANEQNIGLEYISFDLSQGDQIESLMQNLFAKMDHSTIESLT